MSQFSQQKRVRLSSLAANTHKMLFVFSVASLITLGLLYLFVTNHLAIRGYALTLETQQKIQLRDELESLEAQIAQKSASDYISDASYLKDMIVQEQINYFVLNTPEYTAQLSHQPSDTQAY